MDNLRSVAATIPEALLQTVRARPDGVALRWKDGGILRDVTFGAYAETAARVAAGLQGLGLKHGDRVVILMRNRPEFHVADVAVMLLGATPISVYNSSSADQLRHLVGHCQASVAIVEDAEFLERIVAVRDDLPALAHVVLLDDVATRTTAVQGEMTCWDTTLWSELVACSPLDLEAAARTAQPHDLATVIYTSGTTGVPKGVMLDHASICWTVDSLRDALGFSPEGFRIVSYLPMAHIAERMTTHYSGIAFGYEVTTCPDIRLLGSYLTETRPELLFGVPRTYEKIYSAVQALLATDADRVAAFEQALAHGDDEILLPLRQLLGLDAVECAVTAAAPIPVEVLRFFRALGVPLSEMYGLSESSGPVTWEPHDVRVGTVGRAIPDLELRLERDGEVSCRGGNVFRGYLDDPVRTAEVLDSEGWLHTGDIGELDADGYLRIIDRKKDLIITAGGKNVSPANLEAGLKAQPLIGQACAIGEGRPFMTALLVLDADVAPAWAAGHGVVAASPVDLVADPVVWAEIEREVEDANRRFSHAEQIRKFALLADEWEPDGEELTPTMKLKRTAIHAKYADQIVRLYEGEAGRVP